MSPSKYFIPNQSIGNNQCELFHSITRIEYSLRNIPYEILPTKHSLRDTLFHREVECLVKLPEDGHPDSLLVEVVDL